MALNSKNRYSICMCLARTMTTRDFNSHDLLQMHMHIQANEELGKKLTRYTINTYPATGIIE